MKALLISGALFTALVVSPAMADKKSETLPYAIKNLAGLKALSDTELAKVRGGARAQIILVDDHAVGLAQSRVALDNCSPGPGCGRFR
jgi:hypothetical protein